MRTRASTGAPSSTTGTNRFSSFWVKRWVGLFCASAFDTMSMIRASADSLEALVTSISSAASALTVPAKTPSPGPFATGTDSPVIAA